MNQVSIGRHILQLLIAALAVMAVAMLIFVRIFANAAVEYDIRQSLDRVAYKNLKEIEADREGKLIYKEDFVLTDGDTHFVILDQDGRLIRGEYPKGCPQDIPFAAKKQQGTLSIFGICAGIFTIRCRYICARLSVNRMRTAAIVRWSVWRTAVFCLYPVLRSSAERWYPKGYPIL